ncbi:helix-turn-helix domain-containing protein [Streptomyces albidoflavus]
MPLIHGVVPASGPSRCPSEDERIHIADRLRENATARAIAAEPSRSPSTISGEYGATLPSRKRGPAARTPPRPAPTAPAHGPSSARSSGTPGGGRPSRRRRTRSGVRSRSVTLCGRSLPTSRRCTLVHETVYQALYL